AEYKAAGGRDRQRRAGIEVQGSGRHTRQPRRRDRGRSDRDRTPCEGKSTGRKIKKGPLFSGLFIEMIGGSVRIVYQFFQLFSGFEICHTFCRDRYGIACFRVASHTRIAFANAETAETAKFDLFAAVK